MSRVAILLAAGSSRRWGAGNKLFARIEGRTLLSRSLAAARSAPVSRVLVTVGWQAGRIAAAAHGPRTAIVRIADHREGLAASLRGARAAMRPNEREALVFLADMPCISAHLARRLIRAARPGDTRVRPAWRGIPGHPVLLRGEALDALGYAGGDASPVRRADRLVIAGRACVADVDRPGHRRSPPHSR